MSQRPPTHYTDAQIGLMWDRWQRGESLHQIAKLFDRPHSSVRRILAATGGIRPAVRQRADRALTLAEREEISRALMAGQSIRSVAARLSRAPSTISREVRRNGGRDRYRANRADQHAWDQARRPKPCKLAKHRTVARLVAAKLQQQWAPEQIAGWLKRTYPRS
uniref:helix-turn-helix domain-containing protein n=1 Tax=Dyella sp. C11 TaxID=2126991 RepID=UPI0013009C64